MMKATERLNKIIGDQGNGEQEKGLVDTLTLCIEKLTNSYDLCEKSILGHDKRITALEEWAKKCTEATAARAATQPEPQPRQPEPQPRQPEPQPMKSASQPVTASSSQSANSGADGYAVEDGPRVMYKYHKRIKTDDGRFIDTWAGPMMTRKEAEQAGSGLTQEILAWIKNGKVVLVEPIASREKI